MKILVLLSRVPYPIEKGDKLRAFHQLRCLSAKHEVVLFCLSQGEPDQQALPVLKNFCTDIFICKTKNPGMVWNVFKAFFRGIPLQAGYFYRYHAQKKFNAFIRKHQPDHIYCQLLRVAEYVRDLPIPKTLDYQDVFSMGIKRRISEAPFWLKPFFRLEYSRLSNYENQIFEWFQNKTIISEPDRNLIDHPEKEQIHIIPNGVDHEYFIPAEHPKDFDIVFTGNMGYPPNINAAQFLAREIFPLVKQKLPAARLLLAGASPHAKVLSLSSPDIEVTGWVPDIRECYARAKVFIAPMRIGTGLQNKLLEAMSMRLPCITSPLANSALGAFPDREILIGNTPEQYASHIINLLADPELSDYIAGNGHLFVHEKYSWEGATRNLIELIESSYNPAL